MSYPNQHHITISLASANKNNLYSVTNIEAEFEAMKNLKDSGYKLWRYLSMNQDNYEFDLSLVDVMEKTGMKRSTYFNAKKELQEKGYLVEDENRKNGFIFRQTLQEIEVKKDKGAETANSVSLGEPEEPIVEEKIAEPIAEVIELEESIVELPDRIAIYYDDKEAYDTFAKLDKKYPGKYTCRGRYDENNVEYIEALLKAI